MKTYSPKLAEIERRWHVVDAAGQPLGRLASQVASLLKGKHKVTYTPHLDTGDYVVVVNAARVVVTGKKPTQKVYYRHSMYPGGLKAETFLQVQQSHPERLIEHAVKGMLPHNPLGAAMLRKLNVYAGEAHPHQAQVGTREEAVPEEKPQPAPEPTGSKRSKP